MDIVVSTGGQQFKNRGAQGPSRKKRNESLNKGPIELSTRQKQNERLAVTRQRFRNLAITEDAKKSTKGAENNLM